MEKDTAVSIERLRKFLHETYEYDDGALIRKKSTTRWKKGTKVGSLGVRGYYTHYLFGKRYYLHRLIFLYHHGELPDLIDHIDQVKTNNRIENLRPLNKSINGLNSDAPHRDNKLQIKGVFQRKDTKKFVAQYRGKRLGQFKTAREAENAYLMAKQKDL